MKNKMMACLLTFSAGLLITVNATAQDKDTTSVGQHLKRAASKTGHAIGKGAKTVGSKTAELTSKGKSAVVDKVYEGKQGPNGETIYINNKSQYYSVGKTGRHHFFTKAQLKDKNQ